jgi:hypothetical protein
MKKAMAIDKPVNARHGFKSHPLPANSVTIVLENA